MDINKLLDTAKDVCGVRTDGELAGKLGVSKQAMSGYRNGARLPDPVVCATIAGVTGIPLAQVIGIVGEARAISREEKAVWRKLAATAALLAVMVFPALPSQAQAVHGWAKSDPVLCIMRNAVEGLWWGVKYLQLWLSTRFGKPAGPYIEAKL